MAIGINMGGDYEEELRQAIEDGPIGISSSMKEDCFRQAWEAQHKEKATDD